MKKLHACVRACARACVLEGEDALFSSCRSKKSYDGCVS